MANRKLQLTVMSRVASNGARLLREHLVDAQHSRHVELRFVKRRDLAAIAVYRLFTGVVGRERQPDVLAEAIDEKFQIAGSRMHVLPWIIGVRYPEAGGRSRHQLHQPDRAPLRHG